MVAFSTVSERSSLPCPMALNPAADINTHTHIPSLRHCLISRPVLQSSPKPVAQLMSIKMNIIAKGAFAMSKDWSVLRQKAA